jgi:predicted AAA+ superfamily ATPase
LAGPIEKDLRKKFVFLAGPRQVGKTHLAMSVLERLGGRYYNWDLAEDRQKILTKEFLQDRWAVLDELHKYDRWKNFLKGIYDKYHETLKVLVTGSARLDVYRRGGDSLLGRYFLFHLHPFTMGEVIRPEVIVRPEEALHVDGAAPGPDLFAQLFRWGGFPEPFLSGSEDAHRRWSIQRTEILVRQDIRDLTQVTLLSLVEHLMLLLPGRVGSVLSVNSLREDLQVAYNTVRSWLETFERLYITFSLSPWTQKIARSIHKERKLYLWDWSQIKDEGARFENLVASHLWKAVHLWRDLGMGDFGLWFVRDRDRREVDFLITKDRAPWLLIEAKLSETQLSESLEYYADRFGVSGIQVLKTGGVLKKKGLHWIVSADRWLPLLP